MAKQLFAGFERNLFSGMDKVQEVARKDAGGCKILQSCIAVPVSS